MKGGSKMNRRLHFFTAVGIVLLITSVMIAGSPLTSAAEEKCRIIAIHHPDDFQPGILTANTGDCIVWLNWSPNRARIVFANKAACQNMSAASGFTVYPDGCYVINKLETGMTASLVFTQPGTFDYAIEFFPTTGKGATSQITKVGKILVE